MLGFNNKTIKIDNIWRGEGYLGADFKAIDIDLSLRMINIYGPCHNREDFWDTFLSAYFMKAYNLIIGGDLNFSLGHVES